jgi:hypothetical protein
MVSNETIVKATKYITPTPSRYENITIDFGMELTQKQVRDTSIFGSASDHAVESSEFTYNGQSAYLQDNGAGVLRVVSTRGGDVIDSVGTVNYVTGRVQLTNFKLDSFTGTYVKVYATPKSSDISAAQNTILNIVDSDIRVTVEQTRE